MIAAEFIRRWEECRLTAYLDRPGGVWTIGWGSTGNDVTEGVVWTQERADQEFLKDLEESRKSVYKWVKVTMTDNQEVALTSFVYNLGEDQFRKSTLLRMVNESKWVAAALELVKWHNDNGKKVRGLLRRRLAEASLLLEY